MKKFLLLGLILLSSSSCWWRKKEEIIADPEHASLNKLIEKMNFKEAAYAKRYYQLNNNNDLFVAAGERLLAVGGDQDIEQITRLELAEYYLNSSKYEKSRNYALEYQKLYPGTKDAKKSAFIEIQSYYLDILSSDRDQSNTVQALEHAKEFLNIYSEDTEYKDEIKQIIDSCYKKLVESEINVIDSYFIKYNYYNHIAPLISVKKRVAYINDKIKPNLSWEKNSEYDQYLIDRLEAVEKLLEKESKQFPEFEKAESFNQPSKDNNTQENKENRENKENKLIKD